MIAQNKYFFITCTCELKEKFKGSKFMNKKIIFFFSRRKTGNNFMFK